MKKDSKTCTHPFDEKIKKIKMQAYFSTDSSKKKEMDLFSNYYRTQKTN